MRKHFQIAIAVVAALASASCGDLARSGRSPSQLVIVSVFVGNGGTAAPTFIAGPLLSDVISDTGTIFNDFGRVTLRVILKDQGVPGLVSDPSVLNAVTINRYRVVYTRADGRNTPGVDVPFGFDGAVTATVEPGSDVDVVVELARHVAKAEPPLAALGTNFPVITTIAEVTFYGRDMAGNDVSATANVQVNFGNFAG